MASSQPLNASQRGLAPKQIALTSANAPHVNLSVLDVEAMALTRALTQQTRARSINGDASEARSPP